MGYLTLGLFLGTLGIQKGSEILRWRLLSICGLKGHFGNFPFFGALDSQCLKALCRGGVVQTQDDNQLQLRLFSSVKMCKNSVEYM